MCHDYHLHGLTWRTLGQAILIYFAIPRPMQLQDRTCSPVGQPWPKWWRLADLLLSPVHNTPDVESFRALALQRLAKPPLIEKEIVDKEKEVKRLRNRVGHKRWCQRYTGLMEQARILVQVLRRQN